MSTTISSMLIICKASQIVCDAMLYLNVSNKKARTISSLPNMMIIKQVTNNNLQELWCRPTWTRSRTPGRRRARPAGRSSSTRWRPCPSTSAAGCYRNPDDSDPKENVFQKLFFGCFISCELNSFHGKLRGKI